MGREGSLFGFPYHPPGLLVWEALLLYSYWGRRYYPRADICTFHQTLCPTKAISSTRRFFQRSDKADLAAPCEFDQTTCKPCS